MSIDEAQQAIAAALQVYPKLTACGISARPCAPLEPERVETPEPIKPAEPELLEPKAKPAPERAQWKRAERYIKKHYPDCTDGISTTVIHRKLTKDKDLQAELEKEGGPWGVPSPTVINRVLGRRQK